MSEPDAGRGREDRLFEEAAGWFARMRGPGAERSRPQFEQWLARGEAERRAYNRASEVFAMGKLLGEPRTRLHSVRGAASRRHLLAAALLVLVLAIGAAWLARAEDLSPGSPSFAPDRVQGAARQERQLATGPGEQRSVRLADRSLVSLEGATRLDVLFDSTVRRLELRSGAARFTVAHEVRPFIVVAGGGRITARGTVFAVSLSDNRQVAVKLIEGTIDVLLPAANGTSRKLHRLHGGQAINFGAAARMAPSAIGPAVASEAPAGPREFNSVSLAELVAVANRDSPRPIRLAEPQIGRRRVSGRFRVDDTGLLAERLAGLFDLRIDSSGANEIVLRQG